MAILIDVEPLAPDCCDGCLETLAKAFLEGSPGASVWRPLENRWARYLCEQFTARFQTILEAIEGALRRFLAGDTDLRKATEAPWLRWSAAEFEAARLRLEALDPATMSIDDFRLLISFLLQRYLPDDVIATEAEFLAVRATLLGKIQLNLGNDPRVTDPMIETLTALLPTDFAHVPMHVLTPREIATLNWGRAHAGESIRSVTEQTRHRLGMIALEHAQGAMFGQKEGGWGPAAIRMFDELATTNKDMRRIAVTETGNMVNTGMVIATTQGHRLRRIEAYIDACPFCKSINGKVFEVVAEDAANKNGDTQIWPSKTNFGRSASTMKRVGDHLVERSKDEVLWCAAGVQHPHCRGSWVPVTNRPPEVSEQFAQFLQHTLDQAARASIPSS